MSESTYYDWMAPIRSIILKENMNFALIFPKEVRKKMIFEFYLFRVARVYPIDRVYVLPELAPNERIDFSYLGEAGIGIGADIFAMSEERPFRLLHFGIGIYPNNVRIYKQQPTGFVVTGWSRRVPSTVGDPIDYIDGNLSPFKEPTRASETIMWYKGSVAFGFVNKESITVRPKIRILGAGYDTWLIPDQSVFDKVLKGSIPCRFISVGGLSEIQYTVPDEWIGMGFTVAGQDIVKAMGGTMFERVISSGRVMSSGR